MLKSGDPRPSLARKIDWLLSMPGMDRRRLVAATGSKGLSTVSEWRRTGRIAKPKLLKLAELSGVSADWWLDDHAAVPPPASALLGSLSVVHQESPPYLPSLDRQTRFVALFQKLTPPQQDEVLAQIAATVATNESVLRHLGPRDSRTPPDADLAFSRRPAGKARA